MRPRAFLPCLFVLQQAISCEVGFLAISAGAPVTVVVRGRLTDCGRSVTGASVILVVQQDLNQQTRPVNTRIGPHTTTRDGDFLFDVSPPFAVPGAASMQLEVTVNGIIDTIPGGILELSMGVPARDTARFNADLGAERGTC
jgi:hypothetical protein